MEATKERMEKEQNKKKRDESPLVTNEAGKADDTVRTIIRESIVDGRGDGDNVTAAITTATETDKPVDILAFSRTVRKIDSSLE